MLRRIFENRVGEYVARLPQMEWSFLLGRGRKAFIVEMTLEEYSREVGIGS